MAGDALALEHALQRLGAKRVEATLIACLLGKGPLETKQIVAHTGLRQPEVSVGMQLLRDRAWVTAEALPRAGKGRPMHQYKLATQIHDIRRFYEEAGNQAIQAYQDAIGALRSHLS